MNNILDRIIELDIIPEKSAFEVTNKELLVAMAEHIDLETVTNHELREIYFNVKKALSRIDWQASVVHAVNCLPFGLNQTGVAFEGIKPCVGCPDAMIEDGGCYHELECKAMEIYLAHI